MFSRSKLRPILVVGDSWPTIEVDRDSSLYLLDQGTRNHRVAAWWAEPKDLFVRANELWVNAFPVLFKDSAVVPFPKLEKKRKLIPVKKFSHLLWRCDPPVTLETHRMWALLDCDSESNVVNDPRAMAVWNEKFALLKYSKWAIPSWIINDEAALRRELTGLRGKSLLLKPSAAAASYGVKLLSKSLKSNLAIYRNTVKKYGPVVVLQEVDHRIHQLGEFRFFAIGGRVVDAVQKFPGSNDPVMNWYTTKINQPRLQMADSNTVEFRKAERRARQVAKDLMRDGIFLASIDFIGERILEINVTSPGLLKWVDEVGRFTQKKPKRKTLAELFWGELFTSSNKRR
ncbi:MAG TPA: hypothetical protein PLH57_09200 [Oligoflexia bacterium]|nr:hypothetical protein [Oligoflexia bacterium]